jgi:hypothetical protein
MVIPRLRSTTIDSAEKKEIPASIPDIGTTGGAAEMGVSGVAVDEKSSMINWLFT